MGVLYYCPYCHTIYDNITKSNEKYIMCPKGSCYGHLFEVDENMVYILDILNKKGYETLFHCAGHAYEDYSYDKENNLFIGAYIEFAPNINFSEASLKTLPKEWVYREAGKHKSSRNELRLMLPFVRGYTNLYDQAILHAAIVNANMMLLQWVMQLPLCGEWTVSKEVKDDE